MTDYANSDTDSLLPIQQTRPTTSLRSISDVPVAVEDYVKAEGLSDESRERKRAFALAMLRDSDDGWDAASAVFPYDTGYKVWVKQNWTADPEVQAFVRAAREQMGGEAPELPTETEYAIYLWKCSQKAPDDDTRLKYLRLYAEARGHLKRPAGSDTSLSIVNNKVMVLQSQGSDEQWEARTKAQQQALQKELSEIAEVSEIKDEDAAD